ncbi:uncharacterized protein LOC142004273 isoform X2 [Carettochelys insculpta]|uniref:uncharacterized protein LOC142004273 isoform X2 n=1 Tax=Carettochelys insculpta TaxID=44489 RepID=UPI003EBB9139
MASLITLQLLCAAVTALASQDLVPERCLQGPKVWCQDWATAVECEREQYCRGLWADLLLWDQPAEEDEARPPGKKCRFCTKMMEQLKAMIGDDPDERSGTDAGGCPEARPLPSSFPLLSLLPLLLVAPTICSTAGRRRRPEDSAGLGAERARRGLVLHARLPRLAPAPVSPPAACGFLRNKALWAAGLRFPAPGEEGGTEPGKGLSRAQACRTPGR